MTDRYDNDPFAGIEEYRAPPGSIETAPDDPFDGSGAPPPLPPRSPLLTGLVLGLLLIVVSIALFQLLGDDGAGDAAATGTSQPAGEPSNDGTTDAGTTADETPADTATAGNGTPVSFDPYLSVGTPIPIEDLPLRVDGIGDIKFGQPAADAIGRLIASLGDPDSDTGPRLSVGEWGVCLGDTERVVIWGPFAAIVVVDPDGTETFAGYRFDFALGGFSSEAANLTTLSGLSAGTSYRQLQLTYEDFDVRRTDDPELGPVWRLFSANTGALLLWGPIEGDDIVSGIYAPDACGRF